MDETRGIDTGIDTGIDADDPRLVAAVQEYVAAVESGRRPNRQEFLARHSDIAGELSVCLQGLAFVNSAMAEMEGKPSGSAGSAGGESLTSQPLGDFRLLREIGRGGMGVVYEARQLSLDRRVAVKVLPMAAALDPRHLQRFRNEAQAAAQLHHGNIVPVYAVGADRSVHYYAMQLIEGQSLAEMIANLRAARSGIIDQSADASGTHPPASVQWAPSSEKMRQPVNRAIRIGSTSMAADGRASAINESLENLPSLHSAKRAAYFRIVARLALQAADALAYAHQQGIVHRDIKPANLLLDTQGHLWITDFGLAQMFTDTGLTRTGDMLGTIRYMSPEQASGRAVVLDQRTDIYSLGITMYELLTLERAFAGQNREELLRQITSVEPRSPRSIDKKIPVELENIIGKAAAKDAAERYPTALAMAEDLQRFLDDKPVLARPPSVWNKALKWSRRHRTITVSAAVILLLASAGSTVSSVLIAHEQGRTKDAYLREQHRAAEANEQRRRAEKSFDQAHDAVDFLTSMAINELPTDPQFFQVRWRMLEASLAYYQSFLDQEKDDPARSAQLVEAEARVSAVLSELAAVDELLRKNFEIHLLDDPPVQDDLKLTPQQQVSARSLLWQTSFKPATAQTDSSELTADQVRQAISQDVVQRESAIQKLLTAAQVKRLREISRQIRGVFAFSDSDVAAVMNYTAAQKSAIRSACAEFHNHHHSGPGPGPEPAGSPAARGPDSRNPARRGPADRGDAERADMADLVQRIKEILAPRQLETWALLVGEPYRGSAPPYESWFSPPRRGRDGPGRNPGERGARPGEERGRDRDVPPPPPGEQGPRDRNPSPPPGDFPGPGQRERGGPPPDGGFPDGGASRPLPPLDRAPQSSGDGGADRGAK